MFVGDGVMLGGNSAFAHVGTFDESDGLIRGRVAGQRHAVDPKVSQLYGADDDELIVIGRAVGEAYHFEASPVRLPDARMRSVMTRLEEDSLPPPGTVGDGGIRNGLYALELGARDGVQARLTGVMLLQDGRMLGGDAAFYYLGSYSSSGGRWRGEIVNQEHTRTYDSIFGGFEVGIGFSGRCDADHADWTATALVGKRSLQLAARMRLLHAI
jgi:hypothetical protein